MQCEVPLECVLSNVQNHGLLDWLPQAMGAMNRGLNLPAIQRIMTEFEKESSMMDMKEEMMSDAVDDVMDDEEDEEEEGDKILKEVLDEIGVSLSQQVSSTIDPYLLAHTAFQLTDAPTGLASASAQVIRQPVALGETAGAFHGGVDDRTGDNSGGGGASDEDALQARLDALRRG